MALWTPADLATPPRFIMDAANATSGTSCPNTGSAGGTFAGRGTGQTRSTRNGIDVIRLNGSGDLAITGITAYAGDITVITLYERTSAAASAHALVNVGQWAFTTGFIYYAHMAASAGRWATGDDVVFNGGYQLTSTSAAVDFPPGNQNDGNLDFTAVKIGTSNLARSNGTTITPTSPSDTKTATSPAGWDTTGIYVGGNNVSTERFTGDIAYVAVIPAALSQTDIERYEGWLAWNKGLTARLPAGHPYKSAPPYKSNDGDLSVTLANLTFSSDGGLTAGGALSVTLDTLGISSDATVPSAGNNADLSITFANLGALIDGAVTVGGAASITLGSLGLASAATETVIGSAGITLAGLGLLADGVITVGPINGSLDLALDSLFVDASGKVRPIWTVQTADVRTWVDQDDPLPATWTPSPLQ